MPKVYEILFMFNYPHPSGKAHDIFFTRSEASRVEEMTGPAIERYKALGYIRETEMPDEAHADFLELTGDVQIPIKASEMVAPIIGPESMPYPLGSSGKKLLGRMKKSFSGQAGAMRLLARHDAAEEATGRGYSGPGAVEVGERLVDLENEAESGSTRKRGGKS